MKKPKSGRAKAADKLERYKDYILDRVAGMEIQAIAKKYGVDRKTVSNALDEHDEEFEEAKQAHNARKQAALDAIFDAHHEQLAHLLTASTKNLNAMMVKIMSVVNNPESEKALKPMELAKLAEVLTKIFETTRSTILEQQKAATKE